MGTVNDLTTIKSKPQYLVKRQLEEDTNEAIAEAQKKFKETDNVKVKDQDRYGEVVGWNRRTETTHPGFRFPVLVKIYGEYFSDRKSKIIEYHHDDLEKV